MNRRSSQTKLSRDFIDQETGPGIDPELKELLDHLAEELAKEYIRLVSEAGNTEDSYTESDKVRRCAR